MQIDIGSVLNHFDDTVGEDLQVKLHGIKFITADGRLRTLTGRKNVKSPQRQLRQPLQPKGRVMFNLKYHGTLLLHEPATDSPKAVKVAMITHFKEHASTWQTVYH